MKLSSCMQITPAGLLVYIGHKGELYEVVGGDKKGGINLRNIK